MILSHARLGLLMTVINLTISKVLAIAAAAAFASGLDQGVLRPE